MSRSRVPNAVDQAPQSAGGVEFDRRRVRGIPADEGARPRGARAGC